MDYFLSLRKPYSDQKSVKAFRTLFSFFFVYSFLNVSLAAALSTINPSQFIRNGETLVSADKSFALGFFGKSKGQYLGIWYTFSTDTVVWVANRETPLNDSSGVLKLTDRGTLVLLDSSNSPIWSSNSSRAATNPALQLLDSGNLVVKDGNATNADNFVWQSFDYPCDTHLPEMKLGWNLVTGLNRSLSSWRSADDPARGEFLIQVDPRGLPQIFEFKGDKIQTRLGSWNGLQLTGYQASAPYPISEFVFVSDNTEVYFQYKLLDGSNFIRYVLNPYGTAQWLKWIDGTLGWQPFFAVQADQCEVYAICGANAICTVNDGPKCACLTGFVPKVPQTWDPSNGNECVRRRQLVCSDGPDGDAFLKFYVSKIPDTSSSWYNKSMSLKECESLCLYNCSCRAYANLDPRGGGGCLLWFEDLTDIREFAFDSQGLYIRMAISEIEAINKKKKKKRQLEIALSSSLVGTGIMVMLGFVLYKRKKKLKNQDGRKLWDGIDDNFEEENQEMELPLFDLSTIANATDNFSINNKLGQGGFGPVYKGTLIGGKEIAVKRCSKDSGQGIREFKNEVILIVKLQHRNLVKLLGCCIHDEEKMLVYEYLSNRSLDFFIFDQEGQNSLDWPTCYNIIEGTARGLVYLHQDSRLRIIHRDLKPSNILLDKDMNPKISDFGLAKTFRFDQSHANTNKVAGTYGYMAPEYAVDGIFSMKSDVFSFGVLLIELLSRKKNRGFSHADHDLNLLGHAWTLWTRDRPLELIDKTLWDSCTISEVLRCLHVGLLCVQQVPEDRPSMSSVVLMLGSPDVVLPSPKKPGFYTERNLPESSSRSSCAPCSPNNFSTTLLEAR